MQLPTSIMRDQPSVLFRRDRYFYFWYDGTYLVLLLGLIAALSVSGWQGVNLRWGPGLIPWFLAACYVQILSSVFIHNCTHGNFPRRMNRWIGELTGLIVFTRYASWEILHRRHHKYAEDRDKDPHPAIPGFWNFLYHTMGVNLERNLHQQFYELHGGETAENVEFDRRRSWLSYLTMAVLAWAWWAVLGTVAFWAIYAPSAVVGLVHTPTSTGAPTTVSPLIATTSP